MKPMSRMIAALLLGVVAGCQNEKTPPYGHETPLFLPGEHRQVWAVAPAVNLSGQQVDSLIQADDLFEQLGQIGGLTVIPVNRVAELYSSLHFKNVQSELQAAMVCEQLGCDALIVPTVTVFDPYDPPKFGAALQLFRKGQVALPPNVDVRELARAAAPTSTEPQPQPQQVAFKQAVGMFDAVNGSVRDRVVEYAKGRHEPQGPLGNREYLLNMDRYCGFVYHELIVDLLRSMKS